MLWAEREKEGAASERALICPSHDVCDVACMPVVDGGQIELQWLSDIVTTRPKNSRKPTMRRSQ